MLEAFLIDRWLSKTRPFEPSNNWGESRNIPDLLLNHLGGDIFTSLTFFWGELLTRPHLVLGDKPGNVNSDWAEFPVAAPFDGKAKLRQVNLMSQLLFHFSNITLSYISFLSLCYCFGFVLYILSCFLGKHFSI
jgi:hypothetical protein